MISVIVCSINKMLAAQVKRNIEETIGVAFEIIILDNLEIKQGICKVYNMGASQAKYDILCFVHEDVLFQTNNWGEKLVGYFRSITNLGLVGVAGSKYKSKTPSGWSTGLSEFDCSNILHIDKNGKHLKIISNPHPKQLFQEVVTIDGVFMCASRTAWQSVKFNEELLSGFHLYDIDFSSSVASGFKVVVSFEIDMVHLTDGGDFGNAWLENTLLWHKVNRKRLPLHVSENNSKSYEIIIAKKWLHRLRDENISFKNKLKWISETNSFLFPYLWPHIGVFFFYRMFNKMIK